ncbi:DNA-directed RNA polymerase subunit delta [Evansella caseinilytica]|uniref:Probable DNA-directed RNA polymerase subunit delta n=1 Tax=Evansella caseinilytica TaxID=1503961 RepID=A0A1H3T3I3_9BACI|nr:DNA-directed RNA polymerase subunit delta [Evansella caseinilytica]SDZ44903.1 DNA-directed RNA polymerase subunit delta [Evansella caseinilytica]
MSIKQYSEEQLKEMAMLEVAYEILNEGKDPFDYHTLLKRVVEAKEITEEEMTKRIAHLYTEMSMDGRFVNIGENRWGLRSWYPFDQTEEELSQANKTRKKRRDDEDDDYYVEEDFEDFDEFEDLEDELDELANEDDEDFEEESLDEEEEEEEFPGDDFDSEESEDDLL